MTRVFAICCSIAQPSERWLAQAMGLMLPKNTPRRQLPDEATLESRMDCMKVTSSYSCAALNNVNLDAILDDIKCNLRKEQHTVLELNWHVLYHVLAPIQVRPPSPQWSIPITASRLCFCGRSSQECSLCACAYTCMRFRSAVTRGNIWQATVSDLNFRDRVACSLEWHSAKVLNNNKTNLCQAFPSAENLTLQCLAGRRLPF